MATTDPISTFAAQTQAARAAAEAKKNPNHLGIEAFLTLMTTQLKNQDPMKPLEGTEFVSQLAQFGSVSGIQDMKTSLETLATSLRSTQALNGATLVGRDILAPAESVNLTEGGTVNGEIDVPAGSSSVQIRITDSAGAIVREMSVPPNQGTATFSWNGLRNDGTPAPTGNYEIEAIATAGTSSESLPVLVSGRVSSVSIASSGAGLTLNTAALGAVSMADVRRVM